MDNVELDSVNRNKYHLSARETVSLNIGPLNERLKEQIDCSTITCNTVMSPRIFLTNIQQQKIYGGNMMKMESDDILLVGE